MATLPAQSVHFNQQAANALNKASIASIEATRFREAINEVCLKPEYKNLNQAFVARFAAAETAEDFSHVFESCREQNGLLGEGTSTTTSTGIARAAGNVSILENFRDIIRISDDILSAPVWGAIRAALKVVGSILQAREKMSQINEKIQRYAALYKTVYQGGPNLDQQVQGALHNFNIVVVEFSFDVGLMLLKKWHKTLLKVGKQELSNKLESLDLRLGSATSFVDSSFIVKTDHSITELSRNVERLIKAQTSNTTRIQDGDQGTRVNVLPDLLNSDFTGRTAQLSAIAAIFSRPQSKRSKKCVLTGMPGIGKSQIALRYADDNFTGRYKHILFIRASSQAEIQAELRKLGARVVPRDNSMVDRNKPDAIDDLQQWLQVHRDWLFIVDNVFDSNHILKYLPAYCHGDILFTTRDRSVARSLAASHEIVEVDLFNNHDGRNLVFKLASVANPTEAQQAKASEICHFAKGLPLAIEQLVKLAVYAECGWENALKQVESKAALLKQRMTNSSHEHNVSVGAIVETTLDRVRKTDPRAAALFELLVYFSTSSVPRHLLFNAKESLDRHFKRTHTYIRGTSRTAEQTTQIVLQDQYENAPFHLFDYDPFSLALLRRIFCWAPRSRSMKMSKAQRVDSSSDTKLQKYWASNEHLQAALKSEKDLNDSLKELDASGLSRREHTEGAIWIHDLFADVTQAMVEAGSTATHLNQAHLAASMVYLTFPVAEFTTTPLCEVLLPHAILTVSHLQNAGILNDCTIGAELCHLIATSLGYLITIRNKGQDIENAEPIRYYQQALSGYVAAWKRLLSLPGMTWEKVVLSTYMNYQRESRLGRYQPDRHIKDSYRIGHSAPWRSIQTMLKLGMWMLQDGRLDDALANINMAVGWTQRIFGGGETETFEVLKVLCNAYNARKEYPQAYAVRRKMAAIFMGFPLNNDYETSEITDAELQKRASQPSFKKFIHTKRVPSSYRYLDRLNIKLSPQQKLKVAAIQRPLKIAVGNLTQKLSRFRMNEQQPWIADDLDRTDFPEAGLDSEAGCEIAAWLGEAASRIPGREKECIFWWQVSYGARALEYGNGARETIFNLMQISRAQFAYAKGIYVNEEGGDPDSLEVLLAALENQNKRVDEHFQSSLRYAMKAVDIALKGDDARGSIDPTKLVKPAPTERQRIKAGEQIDCDYDIQGEEEEKRQRRYVRQIMRDRYAEAVIATFRQTRAGIPEHMLYDKFRRELDELEVKIAVWDAEQYHYREENFPQDQESWEHENLAEAEPTAAATTIATATATVTTAVDLPVTTLAQTVVKPVVEVESPKVTAELTNEITPGPAAEPVTTSESSPEASQTIFDAV